MCLLIRADFYSWFDLQRINLTKAEYRYDPQDA
jgi:hypothetical protein